MKSLILGALLVIGCDLPSGEQLPQETCAPAPDAGPNAAKVCTPIGCCGVKGNVLLCPPDGVVCRDCRPDPVAATFCCGPGCP